MQDEKRRFRRMDCSGSASVQISPTDPLWAARILDLSAGGCLLQFRKPPQLEMDTKVEIRFCVNHLPFRVLGQVRVVRSATRIGFEFPQLRERVVHQLEDLIEELKERLVKRCRSHVPVMPVQ